MEQEWQLIKDEVRKSLPRGQYELWVATLEPLGVQQDCMVLGCRNRLHIEWVREKLEKQLLKLVLAHLPQVARLEYQIMPDNPMASLSERDEGDSALRQVALEDVIKKSPPLFNRRFTFDQFVIGGCNRFAHAASMAVATGQHLFQPCVYLLSETGLGKSHLSHAVGNYLQSKKPDVRVHYVTAEQFANEMIFSLKRDCIEAFKQKYRSRCDVLIMEKIEFLSGKAKIQNEVVYTMDELLDRGKHILCTGSAHPKDIPSLNNELRSRLGGVLVAPIDPPDFKTRFEIVRRRASCEDVQVSDKVMEFLAGTIKRDVRQLESCILATIAKSRALSLPITIDLAEEVTKTLQDHLPKLTVEYIQQQVCESFRISPEELKSNCRRKELATARKIGMYLCRNYTSESLVSIGKAFGRAHSSVLYSINSLNHELEAKNNKVRRHVEYISRRLETSFVYPPE
jgi:chromosomal replication initiator protein